MPEGEISLRLTRDEAVVLWWFTKNVAAGSHGNIDHVAEEKVLVRLWRQLAARFGCDPEWAEPDALLAELAGAQGRVDAAEDPDEAAPDGGA